MIKYDFNQKLEQSEFENLARDVIQIRENIILESFADGPDEGIDFRWKSKDDSLIVQVKNYKDFKSLYNVLKRSEIFKLKSLNPKRYILVTSVSLTPMNKSKIEELFKEFSVTTKDIISSDDLNNYLGLKEYQEIEINYPNLWFNSGNVFYSKLENILHHEIYEESRYEYEQIVNLIKHYVPLKEIPKLIDNLLDERFLLITGGPGVGKTSLARYIISYFTQKKGYNFIFTKRVSEANNVYNPKQKQIFFFDDFWGSSFKEDVYGYEEESKLGDFIKKINKTDNKILILTSRDYVLEQGLLSYGKLKDIFNKNKHTINIKSLDFNTRKNILVKLLCNSNLSADYIESILYNLDDIIEEEHFNPRILYDFINNNTLKFKNKHEFINAMYNAVIKPFEYYQNIYNYLNINAKLALYLIRTTGEISYNNFVELYKNALDYSINNTNLNIELFSASNIIKQLDKSFINIIDINGEKIIKFQNNSIPDFLISYDEENLGPFEKIIINSLTYFDQIKTLILKNNLKYRNFLKLNNDNYEKCVDILTEKFEHLKIINEEYYNHEMFHAIKEFNIDQQTPFKLLILLGFLKSNKNDKIKNLVIKEFNIICMYLEENNRKNFANNNLNLFIKIVELIKKYTKINSLKMIDVYFRNCKTLQEFDDISNFNSFYPKRFKEFIYTPINSNRLLIEGYTKNIVDAYEKKDYELLLKYSNIIRYNYFNFSPIWLKKINKYFNSIPKSIKNTEKFNYLHNNEEKKNANNKWNIIHDAKKELKISDNESLSSKEINLYIKEYIKDLNIQKKCIKYIKDSDDFIIYNYETLNYIVQFFNSNFRKPDCITELIKWIIQNIIDSEKLNSEFFFKYMPLFAFNLKFDNKCFILDNIKGINQSILKSDEFSKILDSSLFTYDGKWYRFINPIVYKYLYFIYIKDNNFPLDGKNLYFDYYDDFELLNYKIPIEIDAENYAKQIHLLLSDFFDKATEVKTKYDVTILFLTYFEIQFQFEDRTDITNYSLTINNHKITDLLEYTIGEFIIEECFPIELFNKPGIKKYIKYNYYSYKNTFKNEKYIFDAKIHFNDKYYINKLEKYGVVDKIYNYYLKIEKLYEFTKYNFCHSLYDYNKLLRKKCVK